MRTSPGRPQELQNTSSFKTQQEPSGPGTFTIVDNRPSTIYQRKLRETMNSHTASKILPIQRNTPKGSSRFRQIARAMGAKHGVDTSGLVATHNSSFPGKLNAEATIQGNKIHFAPGMDTYHNIKHEVAHAIDNTLNGTPKGNREVNGYKVDTTREEIVDRMAKGPLRPVESSPLLIQRKGMGKEHGTLQLKQPTQKALNKNTLNVVGEKHAISSADMTEQLRVEVGFANNFFKQGSNNNYWHENEIYGDSSEAGFRNYGDSPYLIWIFLIADIYMGLAAFKKNKQDKSNVLENEDKEIEEIFKPMLAGKGINEKMLADKEGRVLGDFGKFLVTQKNGQLSTIGGTLQKSRDYENPKWYNKNNYAKDGELLKLLHTIQEYNPISEQIAPHKAMDGGITKDQAVDKNEEEVLNYINDFLRNECPYLSAIPKKDIKDINADIWDNTDDLEERKAWRQGNFSSAMMKRSRHMQRYAAENHKKVGLWKVGNDHIREIQEAEGSGYIRKYTLIDKNDFKDFLESWSQNNSLDIEFPDDVSTPAYEVPDFL